MDFAIALDPSLPDPLYRQLCEGLRRAILSGQIRAGQRLPSTRALAKLLCVSRATVCESYDQLISEGYLETKRGSGTFACAQLPNELLCADPISTQTPSPAAEPQIQLSAYGRQVLSAPIRLASTLPPSLISFRYGSPALDCFPLQQWRQLLSRYCRRGSAAMLDYTNDILGYQPLREAIAQYLARSRAVRCDADRIIIVNGSQQAINLVTRISIERGDIVALEEPGYPGARESFRAQGAKLLPIPVDREGIQVDCLSEQQANLPKLIYITPSHQFPTGAALSLSRRFQLLAWAAQTGAIAIEDDYDSEFRYEGRPLPALQGLDRNHSVLYIGTFSKVLFPSLRLGYLVVPKPWVQVLSRAKWFCDRQSSFLEQYALTDFINEGHLERHIRRMRLLYDRRRQALIQALTQHFEERIEIIGENAGMHLMIRFDTPLDTSEILTRFDRQGVEVIDARQYYLDTPSRREFVLGYAELDEAQLVEGVKRMAQSF